MGSLSLRVFGFVLLNVFALSIAQGAREFQWVLGETNYTRLGVEKPILTVNGEFPGPALNLTYGEKVLVHVTNLGPYGVTIHWHGVKQPRNPWSDGPEYVTQCPIKSGDSYTYVILLSDEEGTLWWHAHSDWSRATVYGAMYISPKNGIAPYGQPDGEFPIILGAWFNGDIPDLLRRHMDDRESPAILDANASTINGQTGNQIGNTNDADVYTMNVERDKTYLLRFICNTMTEEMYVAVANHNLTVVGVDGAYVQSFTTDYIFITPGQTVDVLINTDQEPDQYYMFGRALESPGAIRPIVNALLNYTDQPGDINGPYTPNTTLPERSDISASYDFTGNLRHIKNSDYPINLPNPQNITRIILNSVAIVRNAALNNIHFVFPKIDILQAYFNGTDDVYTTDFPLSAEQVTTPTDGTRVFEVEYNTTVELVFQSHGGSPYVQANHPMHLHGYSFYLLGSKDEAEFNPRLDPEINYNLVDPPLINTISLPLRGWAAVRFRADNPGVWFMHCHLEKHASWGMETVMIVKDGTGAGEQMIPPPFSIAPCED